MDKRGIAHFIRRKTKGGISYTKAYEVVNIILDVIKEGIERDGKVTLPNFGSFYKRWHNPTTIRDIQTKTIRKIPGYYKVVFKPSSKTIQTVQEQGSQE